MKKSRSKEHSPMQYIGLCYILKPVSQWGATTTPLS